MLYIERKYSPCPETVIRVLKWLRKCGFVQQLILLMLRDLILQSHDSHLVNGDLPFIFFINKFSISIISTGKSSIWRQTLKSETVYRSGSPGLDIYEMHPDRGSQIAGYWWGPQSGDKICLEKKGHDQYMDQYTPTYQKHTRTLVKPDSLCVQAWNSFLL